MRKYLLPNEGEFYKANLHTHTNRSDGAQSPEKVKEVYKDLGYSVVAYTDHDIFIDSQHLTDDTFVALNGVEYSSPLGDPFTFSSFDSRDSFSSIAFLILSCVFALSAMKSP